MPAVTLVTATLRYTPEPSTPWPPVPLPHPFVAGAVGAPKTMIPDSVVVTATVSTERAVSASLSISGTPGEYAREVSLWLSDTDDLPEFAATLVEHAKQAVLRAAVAVAA